MALERKDSTKSENNITARISHDIEFISEPVEVKIKPKPSSKSYYKREIESPTQIYFKRNELKIFNFEDTNCKTLSKVELLTDSESSYEDTSPEEKEHIKENEEILEKFQEKLKSKLEKN